MLGGVAPSGAPPSPASLPRSSSPRRRCGPISRRWRLRAGRLSALVPAVRRGRAGVARGVVVWGQRVAGADGWRRSLVLNWHPEKGKLVRAMWLLWLGCGHMQGGGIQYPNP